MRLYKGIIAIRRAQREDYEPILRLIGQLPGQRRNWRGEGLDLIYETLLGGEEQEAFVATLGRRVIGFISLYYMKVLHHGGKVASVQEIVVTEELRGRGVGRALLDFARQRAKELSCVGLELAYGLPGLGAIPSCRLGRGAGLGAGVAATTI